MSQRSGEFPSSRHRTRRLRRAVRPAAVALVLAVAVPLVPAPARAACLADAGASHAVLDVPATAPGAPTGVTVEPGDESLTVSWVAPDDDGGSPITGFTVWAYHNCEDFSVSAGASATSATVTGLTNGVEYDVYVTATNAVGTGSGSTGTVGTPVDAPQVVVNNQPSQLRVGGPNVTLPVAFELDGPKTDVQLVLQEGTNPDDSAGYDPFRLLLPGPGPHFHSTWSTPASAFHHWGAHQWLILQPVDSPTVTDVSVRLHSLLGFTLERSGDTVALHASARAYHSVLDTYKPWGGRPVQVQRWTSSGWQPIRTLTTDAHGNADTAFTIPWTVGLRVSTADTAVIWGRTTGQGIA